MPTRTDDAELGRTVAHARTLLVARSPPGAEIDASARTVASLEPVRSSPPPARPPLPRIEVRDGGDAELGVTGVLGEGGMGIVHVARQRSLERDVAVKRIKPAARPDAAHVAALLEEAVTTGSLEHPSIVPVHALGRDDGGDPVLVMKKVDGVPLSALVHDAEHAGWSRVRGDRDVFLIETAMKLCDALAFAHSRGVVHRDVKPDNVMIGDFGEVVLLDWGIAARVGTTSSSIAGTPAYMAPEMLRPDAAPLDVRTDVYLLGATLHECLAHTPPHGGKTLDAVLFSIARSDAFEYDGDVPPDLAAILHAAMAPSLERRPASMAALRELLASHLEHRSAAALAVAARARLVELEALVRAAPPDPVAVHAAFHACRFGLEEALRGWPENVRAKDDLDRALVSMTRFEIAERNRGGAAALLAALASPPADLVAELERLDAELAGQAEERARLEQIDRDFDQGVSAPQRVLVARLVAVVMALGTAAFIGIHISNLYEPNALSALLVVVPLMLGAALAAWLGRRAFFRNRVNRHMTLALFVMMAAIALERIGAVGRDHSISEIVAADALIIGAGSAMASLSIRRLYLVPALLFGTASVAAAYVPHAGPYPAFAAGAITVLVLAVARGRLKAPLLDAFDERAGGRSIRPPTARG